MHGQQNVKKIKIYIEEFYETSLLNPILVKIGQEEETLTQTPTCLLLVYGVLTPWNIIRGRNVPNKSCKEKRNTNIWKGEKS